MTDDSHDHFCPHCGADVHADVLGYLPSVFIGMLTNQKRNCRIGVLHSGCGKAFQILFRLESAEDVDEEMSAAMVSVQIVADGPPPEVTLPQSEPSLN